MEPETNETKCRRCGQPVHFFRAKTGGKRYGSCGCDTRTWVLDGDGAYFVEHTTPEQHSQDCSCSYAGRPEHARDAKAISSSDEDYEATARRCAAMRAGK